MSEKQKSARLVLNTALFYPYASTNGVTTPGTLNTALGTADGARLNCTFTNLDWQQILGDMYDQYSTFSFIIESITYMNSGGTPFGGGLMNITATGLDWQNQTYDVNLKTKGSGCLIYNGSLYGTAVPQIDGPIFRRPQTRYMDFTLNITSPLSGSTAYTYNSDRAVTLCYVIKLFGIDKIVRK